MTKEELKQHIIDECRDVFEKAKEMEYLNTESPENDITETILNSEKNEKI